MKTSNIEWAKCPHCSITLNTFDGYPASVLMRGDSKEFAYFRCISCDERILVACKITIAFTIVKEEQNENDK